MKELPAHDGSRAPEKPGDLLHPQREPQAVLDELKRSMGSADFSAQYQQAPVPPGGDLIKWAWFRCYQQEPNCQPGDRIIVSWDTAMSPGELSDYSVCIVILVRGETVYVLEVFRDRLGYPALKHRVIEMHQQWRHATKNYALLIENKGSGMGLIQDLRQLNIHAVPILPDGDKIMRMNRQTARIEAGSVLLPEYAPWLDDFHTEILAFPASRHDDQVDAFSQALDRAFNYRGYPARMGRY